YHLYTLREHGITVAGPPISPLIAQIDPDDMRRAAAPLGMTWLEQSHHDPTWLEWISEQRYQAFVILTLCRLLYTLETGSVTSKPAAARWAKGALGPHWAPFIERALTEQHSHAKTPQSDMDGTIEMVQYTADRFQRWQSTIRPAQP
ncbi:MAG: aminoglycoside adenylyltransferase domain-containing protein, partial [Chloroflexia bacterium]